MAASVIWACKVSDEKQLEDAISKIDQHKEKLRFIEVMMRKEDSPETLKKIGEAASKLNKY